MACDMCGLVVSDEDLIMETVFWKAFLATNQSYPGTCIIPLKRHAGNLADLGKAEWEDFSGVVQRLEGAIRESLGATLFNWSCLMNDAYKRPQPAPHVHWQVRPRYREAVVVGGHSFNDAEFAHHYDHKKTTEIAPRVRAQIVRSVRSAYGIGMVKPA
ncbi:MAG: HIT family protein [Candidatus Aenigmarchaeota archaeon]|nr:HIT family protein [Candidatus Aenigmarchaeota archaeon]